MKECFVQKMHTWVLCVDMEFNIYRFSKLAWVVSLGWSEGPNLEGKRDKFNFQVIVLIRQSEKDWPVLEYSIGW